MSTNACYSANSFSVQNTTGLDESLQGVRRLHDRRIFWLLSAQWALILTTALISGLQSVNDEFGLYSTVVIATGLSCAIPIWLLGQFPGSRVGPWSVAVCQGALSTVLWTLFDGRGEAHLHLFTWIFALGYYRDLRLIFLASAVALGGDIGMYASSGMISEFAEMQWLYQYCWFVVLTAEAVVMSACIMFERLAVQGAMHRSRYTAALHEELRRILDHRIEEMTAERRKLKSALESEKKERERMTMVLAEEDRMTTSLRSTVTTRATNLMTIANRAEASHRPDDWQSIRAEIRALQEAVQSMTTAIDLEDSTSDLELSSLLTERFQSSFDALETQDDSITETSSGVDLELPTSTMKALLLMRNGSGNNSAKAALKAAGYCVEAVASGTGLYSSAAIHDYDLILVDVDLPNEEGFDTIEALRILPGVRNRQKNRVFALTSKLTPDRILHCTHVGVDGILLNPLTSEALQQISVGSDMINNADPEHSNWCWVGGGLAR